MCPQAVAPLPDPVGPVAKTVRDGLNRRLSEDWAGVLEDNNSLRMGLSGASRVGGQDYREGGCVEQYEEGSDCWVGVRGALVEA